MQGRSGRSFTDAATAAGLIQDACLASGLTPESFAAQVSARLERTITVDDIERCGEGFPFPADVLVAALEVAGVSIPTVPRAQADRKAEGTLVAFLNNPEGLIFRGVGLLRGKIKPVGSVAGLGVLVVIGILGVRLLTQPPPPVARRPAPVPVTSAVPSPTPSPSIPIPEPTQGGGAPVTPAPAPATLTVSSVGVKGSGPTPSPAPTPVMTPPPPIQVPPPPTPVPTIPPPAPLLSVGANISPIHACIGIPIACSSS